VSELSIGLVRKVLSTFAIQVHVITSGRGELSFRSEGVLLLWWAPAGHGPRVWVGGCYTNACVPPGVYLVVVPCWYSNFKCQLFKKKN
ncbi:unnamed protein product, partial [Pylaiella littoralis]